MASQSHSATDTSDQDTPAVVGEYTGLSEGISEGSPDGTAEGCDELVGVGTAVTVGAFVGRSAHSPSPIATSLKSSAASSSVAHAQLSTVLIANLCRRLEVVSVFANAIL